MGDERISYQPTDGLSYDPSDARYWDPEALDGEVSRVFEICHGCRMCFKYCDVFPRLFDLLDEKHDGDVRKLDHAERGHVMDACFQCKLCEVQCPYTPTDGHAFQVDFPRLVHRYDAQRAREGRLSLRDRILGNPDATGQAARATLGVASSMNRVGLHRWFLEKVLGVHRDKLLPEFARTTFESWAEREGLTERGTGGEVALFQTCYVQHNEPQIGRDTLEVMAASSVDVRCLKGLRCCGMPAWERGDLERLRELAAHNLELLVPHVESGSRVVAINPTCSMMIRREWPQLLEGLDRERARLVSEAVMDPSEFLWSIRKEPRFNSEFRSTPGPVAYHAPCHLRAQRVGLRGRDLLRQIPGANPTAVMECCGHDGTHAMRVEGFDPSQRAGARAFGDMKDVEGAEVWATDCPLAALQFQQFAGRKPMHPMSILARAYREDGFATPVGEQEEP